MVVVCCVLCVVCCVLFVVCCVLCVVCCLLNVICCVSSVVCQLSEWDEETTWPFVFTVSSDLFRLPFLHSFLTVPCPCPNRVLVVSFSVFSTVS